MEAIIVVPVVFITLYLIIELFVHRRERLMMIEKLSQGQSLDMGSFNLLKSWKMNFSGLKIGCLLCGLGLGFFMAFTLDLSFGISMHADRNLQELMYMACVLTFGGIGLIVAHCLERPKKQ